MERAEFQSAGVSFTKSDAVCSAEVLTPVKNTNGIRFGTKKRKWRVPSGTPWLRPRLRSRLLFLHWTYSISLHAGAFDCSHRDCIVLSGGRVRKQKHDGAMKKNGKQGERMSCHSHSGFLGFNISFSCTHLNLLFIGCHPMPARRHFHSGCWAHDRGTEGQDRHQQWAQCNVTEHKPLTVLK